MPGENKTDTDGIAVGPENRKLSAENSLMEIYNGQPERMQFVVWSFYVENKTVKQIAAMLGCSISTTRVALHKGRHRLREVDKIS